MILPRLYDALLELENAKPSGDGSQLLVRCPFCGDSKTDLNPRSLSIKVDVNPGEPILYQCFRASCGAKGALRTSVLQDMGITDMSVISELAQYNSTVNKNFDKPFSARSSREYALVNLPISDNVAKLSYINNRLGLSLKIEDLKNFKIQLSLLEMLRLNDIRRLSVKRSMADAIDAYTIGFVSMFSDYMVCRDITPDLKTGKRYYSYRISGKPDPDDLKIYCIPCEIDIMDPHSAEINVAEGPFSILGAYMNTSIGGEKKNSIWLANCGSQFTNTILRVCKQYGLLRVRLNIWSDSEIGMKKYNRLYTSLKDRLDIRRMSVYYNDAADDFGHPKSKIKVREATVK